MIIWYYRDKGDYTCSAENGVGEAITKTVKLNINGNIQLIPQGTVDNKLGY